MYIVIVDSFSNWPSVIKTGEKQGAKDLVKTLRRHQDFGVPEVLTSDEGPEFTALKIQEFLRWSTTELARLITHMQTCGLSLGPW